MKKKVFLALAVLSLGTVFCSLPGTPAPDIEATVAAKLTAAAGSGSAPTDTLSTTPMSSFPDTGLITGSLTYPAEAMPPERVVAWSTADSSYYYIDTGGAAVYSLEVPVGTYYVVAYSIGGGGFPSGLAGGYSQAVPCGNAYGCDDHSLIPVTVTAGATATGIDPTDWYAPDGAFPPMP